MRSQPGSCGDQLEAPMSMRCAEFHSYAVSGGLLDADHRDLGSTLTMSVALSDADLVGGDFVTYRTRAGQAGGREPVVHKLERGDAILFHSERRHNVTTVEAGMRHSLVLELWVGGANEFDRYS